jgi:hypothetical protein
MRDPPYFGVCCFKYRAITYDKCNHCRREYECAVFRSLSELVAFNKLIPPSMLREPLPLNLWPNLWNRIGPQTPVKCESPVQLLASALGLVDDEQPDCR